MSELTITNEELVRQAAFLFTPKQDPDAVSNHVCVPQTAIADSDREFSIDSSDDDDEFANDDCDISTLQGSTLLSEVLLRTDSLEQSFVQYDDRAKLELQAVTPRTILKLPTDPEEYVDLLDEADRPLKLNATSLRPSSRLLSTIGLSLVRLQYKGAREDHLQPFDEPLSGIDDNPTKPNYIGTQTMKKKKNISSFDPLPPMYIGQIKWHPKTKRLSPPTPAISQLINICSDSKCLHIPTSSLLLSRHFQRGHTFEQEISKVPKWRKQTAKDESFASTLKLPTRLPGVACPICHLRGNGNMVSNHCMKRHGIELLLHEGIRRAKCSYCGNYKNETEHYTPCLPFDTYRSQDVLLTSTGLQGDAARGLDAHALSVFMLIPSAKSCISFSSEKVRRRVMHHLHNQLVGVETDEDISLQLQYSLSISSLWGHIRSCSSVESQTHLRTITKKLRKKFVPPMIEEIRGWVEDRQAKKRPAAPVQQPQSAKRPRIAESSETTKQAPRPPPQRMQQHGPPPVQVQRSSQQLIDAARGHSLQLTRNQWNENMVYCELCDATFPNQFGLQLHMTHSHNWQHTPNMLTCPSCSMSFYFPAGLEWHLNPLCRTCGKLFPCMRALSTHMHETHGVDMHPLILRKRAKAIPAVVCQQPDFPGCAPIKEWKFSSEPNLMMAIFFCVKCCSFHANEQSFASHMVFAHQEPNTCPICASRRRSVSALVHHVLQTHHLSIAGLPAKSGRSQAFYVNAPEVTQPLPMPAASRILTSTVSQGRSKIIITTTTTANSGNRAPVTVITPSNQKTTVGAQERLASFSMRQNCPKCNISFLRRESLQLHNDFVHGSVTHRTAMHGHPQNLFCVVCREEVASVQVFLKHHSQCFNPDDCLCDLCPATVVNELQRRDHMLFKHGAAISPSQCFSCLQTLMSEQGMRSHLYPQCPFCHVFVACMKLLMSHCSMYHNFRGGVLGLRSLVDKSSGESRKRYDCGVCAEKFYKLIDFWLHVKTCHNAAITPNVACHMCGTTVKSAENLLYHVEERHGIILDFLIDELPTPTSSRRKKVMPRRLEVMPPVPCDNWSTQAPPAAPSTAHIPTATSQSSEAPSGSKDCQLACPLCNFTNNNRSIIMQHITDFHS